MAITLFIPELNNVPAFNRGDLVYKNSGHTLTQLNGYYICSQRQKRKCVSRKEENLKVIDFKRRFERYVEKLKADEAVLKKLFFEIDRQGVDLREKLEPEEKRQINNMDACIKAIESDLRNKKKINFGDVSFFKEAYLSRLKINYEYYLLLFVVMGTLKDLGIPKTSTERMANWLATLVNKIYLSDTGKILEIKMEGIGDYILRIIENKIPGYLEKAGVKIVERINFSSLNFVKVMDYFRENKYRDTLSFFPFGSQYAEEKQIKQVLEPLKNLGNKELVKTLYFLKDTSKSPLALLNLKMFSKNNNEKIAVAMEKNKARYGKNIKYTAIGLTK